MISKERLLQLCFDEEEFKGDVFSAAKFVVDKRRHTEIEVLHKDLQAYCGHLKEEVIQLINTDLYDRFLNVSNKLVGLDTELARVVGSFPEMTTKVDKAASKVSNYRGSVTAKLKEAQKVTLQRRYYVQLLKLSMMEDKIGDWLLELTNSSGAKPETTKMEQLPMIRRIAIECRQLIDEEESFVPVTADQEEERTSLIGRTSELRNKFTSMLEDRFIGALQQQQQSLEDPIRLAAVEPNLLACLEGFYVLQKEDVAADLFHDQVCSEVVDKVLSWQATGNQRNAPPEALAALFDELWAAITKRCLPMVSVAAKVSPTFKFVHAIWRCVYDVIVKRMQNIFSPGIQGKFHACYTAAHRIVINLERQLTTPEALESFRSSSEMQAWNGKWLLSVYIALRQKELIADLDVSLQRVLQRQDPELMAATGYTYAQVYAVHRLAFWLWGDSVFLYPIGDQLLKMVLRVAAVLRQWLAKYWETAALPATPATSAAVGSVGTEPHSPIEDLYGSAVSKDPREQGLAMTQLKVSDLVALACDLLQLQDTFNGEFLQMVCSQLAINQPVSAVEAGDEEGNTKFLSSSSPIRTAAAALCSRCTQEVAVALDLLVLHRLVELVAKECIDALVPPLKSIPSLYRMTKKPTPTRYSFFVPTLLSAMQTFQASCQPSAIGNARGKTLPQTILRKCIEQMLTAVTDAYYDEAKALLSSAKKAEKAISTMRKQQKRRDSSTKTDGREEMGDTDKIYVQVYLDIQEFGNQFQTHFGINKTDFVPYQRLVSLTRRAMWLLGLIAEEPKDEDEGGEEDSSTTTASGGGIEPLTREPSTSQS